jgi:hypothetical protein
VTHHTPSFLRLHGAQCGKQTCRVSCQSLSEGLIEWVPGHRPPHVCRCGQFFFLFLSSDNRVSFPNRIDVWGRLCCESHDFCICHLTFSKSEHSRPFRGKKKKQKYFYFLGFFLFRVLYFFCLGFRFPNRIDVWGRLCCECHDFCICHLTFLKSEHSRPFKVKKKNWRDNKGERKEGRIV